MREQEPQTPMTPGEYLASCELTKRLKKLGATDALLEAIRFTGFNQGWPFDLWPFTWGPGPPPLAYIGHLKTFAALKWLILENPPSSPDKDAACRLVNESLAAPIYETGLRHKTAQQRRARKPRGRFGDDSVTMLQVVHALARQPEHREQTARELWPHLFAKLEKLGVDPVEEVDRDPRKAHYTYDFNHMRKKVTFGHFSNLVSQVRCNQNSG
jgi:hypothetical protein